MLHLSSACATLHLSYLETFGCNKSYLRDLFEEIVCQMIMF